ncbi:uncharacterized protein L199_006434 [Kwoniella botswanensis]|uniref:uncharacterized protein n=1 Tax=Kwoniella botswanensis TaxID=1268659 RepID=UPI00315DDA68
MPPARRSVKSSNSKSNTSSSSSSASAQAASSVSSMNGFPRPFDEKTILRNALQETERKAIILEGQLANKEEEYTKLFQETTQLDERLKQYSSRVNDIEENERLRSTIKVKEEEIRRIKMEHINCDIDRCNQLLLIVDDKKEDQVMIGNQFSNRDSDLFLLHRKELLDELKSLKESNNQLNQQLKNSDEELSNQIAINISTQDQIDELLLIKMQYEELKMRGSKKMKKELVFANNRNTELNERLTKMEEEKGKLEEENENLKEEIAKLNEKVDSHENEGNKDASSDTDKGPSLKVKEGEAEVGGTVTGSKGRKGKKRASETGGSDKDSKRSKAGWGGEANAKGGI